MKNSTQAGTGIAVATSAMFALGGAALFDRPVTEQVSDERNKASAPVTAAPRVAVVPNEMLAAPVTVLQLDKPATVTLASSTGKLRDLFKRIGYELDGVRKRGEVPRVFLASLPADLKNLRRADLRKVTFIKTMLPLILHVNELVLQDRRRLLSIRSQIERGETVAINDKAWLNTMAELYGQKTPDIDGLLVRVDVIPPSLAIAQAAEESGWGTSRFAREGNALFGQRIYKAHKKGMVPAARDEGKRFRVRAFDHLIDGVKAYVYNLNTHFAYDEFRETRARQRDERAHLDGHSLVGTLHRYSERGEDYIKTIRLIMRVNALPVFDSARLGDSVEWDEDSPDA